MDAALQQFIKINILNDMSNDIGYFAESNGVEKLLEHMDLTCGAIPEGSYGQIIDPSAPEPFLELYTHVVEYRFAVAVTQALRLSPAVLDMLKNYCVQKGQTLINGKLNTVEAAYEAINSFVLDGMYTEDTKNLTVVEPNKLVWEKLTDTHEEFWSKANGNLQIYYDLQSKLIEGMLSSSEIKFSNEGNKVFTLSI